MRCTRGSRVTKPWGWDGVWKPCLAGQPCFQGTPRYDETWHQPATLRRSARLLAGVRGRPSQAGRPGIPIFREQHGGPPLSCWARWVAPHRLWASAPPFTSSGGPALDSGYLPPLLKSSPRAAADFSISSRRAVRLKAMRATTSPMRSMSPNMEECVSKNSDKPSKDYEMVAREARDLLCLVAGLPTWADNRKAALARAARQLGFSFTRTRSIFYGEARVIRAEEWIRLNEEAAALRESAKRRQEALNELDLLARAASAARRKAPRPMGVGGDESIKPGPRKIEQPGKRPVR